MDKLADTVCTIREEVLGTWVSLLLFAAADVKNFVMDKLHTLLNLLATKI